MKKILRHLLLAVALVFGVVLLTCDSAQAAPKPIRTYSDFPVKCHNSKGAFSGKYTQTYGKAARLQGWVAADAKISNFTYEFVSTAGSTYQGGLSSVDRPDVKKAYPSYKYCLGFEFPEIRWLGYFSTYGMNGTLRVYAMVGGAKTLIGKYDISSTDMVTCSDLPTTIAPAFGHFKDDAHINPHSKLNLKGWVASKAAVSTIYAKLFYFAPNSKDLLTYNIPLNVGGRDDVKAAFPNYAYCVGYEMDPIYSNVIKNLINGKHGSIEIYTDIDGQRCLIGKCEIAFTY